MLDVGLALQQQFEQRVPAVELREPRQDLVLDRRRPLGRARCELAGIAADVPDVGRRRFLLARALVKRLAQVALIFLGIGPPVFRDQRPRARERRARGR